MGNHSIYKAKQEKVEFEFGRQNLWYCESCLNRVLYFFFNLSAYRVGNQMHAYNAHNEWWWFMREREREILHLFFKGKQLAPKDQKAKKIKGK